MNAHCVPNLCNHGHRAVDIAYFATTMTASFTRAIAMSSTLRDYLTALFVTVIVATSMSQAGDEQLLEKIFAGWKNLETLDAASQTSNFEFDFSSIGKADPTVKGKVSVNQNDRLIETDTLVFGLNPQYGFLLRKQPNEKNWVLTETVTGENKSNLPRMNSSDHPAKLLAFSQRPLTCFGPTGDPISVFENTYKVKIERVNELPNSILQVHFSSQFKVNGKRGRDYVMLLDPALDYLPLEIKSTHVSQPNALLEERRSISSKSPLRCDQFSYKVTYEGKIVNSVEYRFMNHTNKQPDSAKLKLSYYDFPEPVGIAPFVPPRTGYMMYLYIAIPVFAAFGLFFAYIRRRYFPRAVALPPAGTAGS